MTKKVIDVEVAHCQLFGEGGFAQLRRCRARNVRHDGTRSRSYILDLVERAIGTDAVAALPYQLSADGVATVALRRGLRPAPRLARAGQPTREGDLPSIVQIEVVAGILERDDLDDEGLRKRVAAELAEEIGLGIEPAQVIPLGPPVFLSPGLTAERIYCCCVPADLTVLGEPGGDGSQLEEGGEALLLTLSGALEACASGTIQDAKTELVLRRLLDHLARC